MKTKKSIQHFSESSIVADRINLNDSMQASTFFNYAKTFSDVESFPVTYLFIILFLSYLFDMLSHITNIFLKSFTLSILLLTFHSSISIN